MYDISFDPQRYAQEQMRDYYQDCRDINRTIAKANAVEGIRTQAFAARQLLRQQEEERKKSTFSELIITNEGELQLITRNLSIDAKPRSMTNMRNPSLTILRRAVDVTEVMFHFRCFINAIAKEIFLDPHKTEKISYVKRKFSFAGIYFNIPKEEKRDFFDRLISLMIILGPDERCIPDHAGYFESPEEGLIYVGEEDLTWKKVIKLCK